MEDVRLAIEMAQELGNPVEITPQILARLQEAIDRGWGGEDCDAVVKLQEERSGIQLRF